MGIFFWRGLRFVTFTSVGFYLAYLFTLFSLDDSRRIFLWLPLAFVGLFIMLFGMGQWGRWRYLFALVFLPFSWVVLPQFVDRFTPWYIEWWDDWLWWYSGREMTLGFMKAHLHPKCGRYGSFLTLSKRAPGFECALALQEMEQTIPKWNLKSPMMKSGVNSQ